MSDVDDRRAPSAIATRPCPRCYLCDATGELLYRDLSDRLFSAPGEWTLKRCPNPACGLIWLDPMPLEAELWKAYATYYTHPDDQRAGAGLAARVYAAVRDGYLHSRYGYPARPARRWLAPLMYLHPGARAETDAGIAYQPMPVGGRRLLDVGCGDGSLVAYLSGLGWDAEGIDVDSAAVAAARRQGLRVQLGTLASEPYPPRSFDVLTMSHVIEHVIDPIALLRDCHRVLKPGGTLVLFTPNVESWGHDRFREAWLGLDPPRHLYLFRSATLRTCLDRSGQWTVESLRTTIRGAGGNLSGSAAISRKGRYRMATVFQMGALTMLAAHLWYFRSWRVARRHPGAGEELALIARAA